MKLKGTVRLAGLQPPMVLALLVAHEAYANVGAELVVTSAADSRHRPGSLHYVGLAVDIRTNNLPSEAVAKALAKEIGENLGPEYDVLYEEDHIHVEYQPKDPLTEG
jgi:hypothetical protein